MELTESPDGPDASDDDDDEPLSEQADKKANRKQTSESFSNFILWHPRIWQKLSAIYTIFKGQIKLFLKKISLKNIEACYKSDKEA